MFFALSKILSFLTNPLIFVFGFLLASVWVKKAHVKKRLFWIAFSLLLFFANDFIANEAMQAWEIEPIPYASIQKVYDWGIVLTGVTLNDREPADRVYFHHGADRVTHTIQLYKKGIIKKILISGGLGRLMTAGRPEADALRDVMIMAGVPEADILVERESDNTHENAVNVRTILKNETGENCLLITSAFHMRRAKACFENVGLKAETFTTDFYSHPRHFTPDVLLIPTPCAISLWQKLLKEILGMIAYRVAGYI